MPKYPKKKLAQLLMQACVNYGIEQVVISPGSRNAPLTLGFVNHPKVKTFSIVDERCAAFFAMGLAQQSAKTVALLCTSGSALLNYYPAIAEAYYSKIPLLVISADRPKRLLDIGDGQTIRQEGVFSKHILFQTNLNSEDQIGLYKDLETMLVENAKTIVEALVSAASRRGPVHINVPFDEPLYETVDHLYDFGSLAIKQEPERTVSLLEEEPLQLEDLENYSLIWNGADKKMVIIGSNDPDELMQAQMTHLIKDPSVIILTETTSNVADAKFINNIDQLIFPLSDVDFEALKPEILLTFGGMVISKRIKQILRKHPPQHHWHVDAHRSLDTYHSMTRHFEISPQLFFSQFFFLTKTVDSSFQDTWLVLKAARKIKHDNFVLNLPFSDLKVFDQVLNSLPGSINLQVANSSIIRYAQLFDLDPTIKVYCNRGTSGIDGSTSTALGAAFQNSGQTVFITGDISFFYDSNGLWNKYIPVDFRIIVVNNGGGGIFKFIPGPKSSGALDYFETSHQLNASALCEMFGFDYVDAKDALQLETHLAKFYAPSNKPALLEVFTSSHVNDTILGDYFNNLK